jgi:hypothetical protein
MPPSPGLLAAIKGLQQTVAKHGDQVAKGGNLSSARQLLASHKDLGKLELQRDAQSGDTDAQRQMAQSQVAEHEKAQEESKNRFRSAMRHFGSSMEPQRGFGGPSQALKGIGDITGDPVTKFASGIMDAVDKLKTWTDQLHGANMQFAEFSASMARVQAESEVRTFQRMNEQGERRAASAQYLEEGRQNLSDQMAPIEDLWAKAQNYVGGALSQMTASILEPLSYIAKVLQKKDEEELSGGDTNLGEWGDQLAREYIRETKDRPTRFGGGAGAHGGGDF